jgi:hypothetical protein
MRMPPWKSRMRRSMRRHQERSCQLWRLRSCVRAGGGLFRRAVRLLPSRALWCLPGALHEQRTGRRRVRCRLRRQLLSMRAERSVQLGCRLSHRALHANASMLRAEAIRLRLFRTALGALCLFRELVRGGTMRPRAAWYLQSRVQPHFFVRSGRQQLQHRNLRSGYLGLSQASDGLVVPVYDYLLQPFVRRYAGWGVRRGRRLSIRVPGASSALSVRDSRRYHPTTQLFSCCRDSAGRMRRQRCVPTANAAAELTVAADGIPARKWHRTFLPPAGTALVVVAASVSLPPLGPRGARRVGVRRLTRVRPAEPIFPEQVSGRPSPNPACAFRYAPGSP